MSVRGALDKHTITIKTYLLHKQRNHELRHGDAHASHMILPPQQILLLIQDRAVSWKPDAAGQGAHVQGMRGMMCFVYLPRPRPRPPRPLLSTKPLLRGPIPGMSSGSCPTCQTRHNPNIYRYSPSFKTCMSPSKLPTTSDMFHGEPEF